MANAFYATNETMVVPPGTFVKFPLDLLSSECNDTSVETEKEKYTPQEAFKKIMQDGGGGKIDIVWDNINEVFDKMNCPDCKDGKYIGLSIIEDCKTCNGTGSISTVEQEKYVFGMGLNNALLLDSHDVDFSLPDPFPKPKVGAIINFETNMPQEVWSNVNSNGTLGHFKEKLVLDIDGDFCVEWDIGLYLKFKIIDVFLKNIFVEIITHIRFITYEDLDKILGAYI